MSNILDNIKDILLNKQKKKHKKLPFKVTVKTPDYVENKDLVIFRYMSSESSSSIISKIMKKGKSKFICTEFGNIKKYISPNKDDDIYYTSFKKSHQPHYVCKLSKIKKIDEDTIIERIMFITDNDYEGCDKFIENLESEKSVYIGDKKIVYTKSYINFENKIEISFSNNLNNECIVDFRTSSKYKESSVKRKIKNILKILNNEYGVKMNSDNYIKIVNSDC